MHIGLRLTQSSDNASRSAASDWIPGSSLWQGGLLVLCIVLALSTQLLFQFDLYRDWPITDILLRWLDHLTDQLIVGSCIFLCIALATLIPTKAPNVRHLLLFISLMLGAVVGETLLMLRMPPRSELSVATVFVGNVARWLVVAGLAYAFFVFQRQAAAAAARTHDNELQRIELDRQMAETRLQSLRAQIEPHFLFNTLATIQQLNCTEPDRGREMLANFVTYVRAGLPRMRCEKTTLGQEVDLAKAYLDVLQVRMGKRLRVGFNIPHNLTKLPFPPYALSTLTENAIKHGLNPLSEGGSIQVTASVEEDRLKVSVSDTGAGFQRSSGTGAGLANLRARLNGLYGNTASLEIVANVPRGICATIVVPVEIPDPAEQ